MRSFLAAVVLIPAVMVMGCGEERAVGAGEPSRSPDPAALCPEPGVVLWLREPSTAAGVRSMSAEMYNCGHRARVLNGYPAIRLSDVDLKPLKVTVGHGSSAVAKGDSHDRRPAPVTLEPGEVASTAVLWREPAADDTARAVTAEVLDIVPTPGMPSERIHDAGINLGTTRKLGVSPWEKVREAGGVEVGDNAPHYGDNHAWRDRLELEPADRMVGVMAVGKIRPVLERMRAKGDFTPGSVRTVLLGLGFEPLTTTAYAMRATTGVAFEVYPGRGVCVHGSLQRDRITAKVDGVRQEGGCAEP